MSEAEIQAQVKEMIREKFAKRDMEEQVIDRRESTEYKSALAVGDVKKMIYYQFGLGEAQEREERRDDGYSKLDIKACTSELKDITAKIEGIQTDIDQTITKLEAKVKAELREAEESFFKSGIMRNSLRHEVLRSEYMAKLEQVPQDESVKKLYRQLYETRQRREDLSYYVDRYKHDNADIISDLHRKQVERDIEASGLLEDI